VRWRTCDAQYIDPAMAQRIGKALRRNAVRVDYAAIADPAALVKRLTEDVRARSSTTVISGWSDHPEGRDNVAFDQIERMPGNVGYSIHVQWDRPRDALVGVTVCSCISVAPSRAIACAATAPDLLLRECCRSHGILLFHRR
jgi:hypothetical protein